MSSSIESPARPVRHGDRDGVDRTTWDLAAITRADRVLIALLCATVYNHPAGFDGTSSARQAVTARTSAS